MSIDLACPDCGTAFPPDSKGVCARCVFQMSVVSGPDEAPGFQLEELLIRPMPAAVVRLHTFGDYELLEEVARGGMGVVFKAKQMSLNRVVAIKLVQAGRLATLELRRRFRTEAEAAAALDHPNIVPIYEVGEHDGQPYFSMKLIEGGDLASKLRSAPQGEAGSPAQEDASYASPYLVGSDQFSIKAVVRLLATLGRAVDHAHQRGVLHRDLKPGNILLDEDGRPYLTDFGIAKLIEGSSDQTETLMLRGTPAYMSPEQASGSTRHITTAADVWSLGVILHQLLTGALPFRGDTFTETLQLIQHADPKSPRAVNPSVPRDLETVCLRCLSKEPARRYRSAALFADDLELWLEGVPIRGRRVNAGERFWLWCRRNPVVASLLLALLLALSGGIVMTTYHWQQALHSQKAAIEALYESNVSLASATRQAGRTGQRFESLRLLTEAALRTNSSRLRSEAIASMALPDARPWKDVLVSRNAANEEELQFDGDLRCYATNDALGRFDIRSVDDDSLLWQLTAPSLSSKTQQRAWRFKFSPDGATFHALYPGGNYASWQLLTGVVNRPLGPMLSKFSERGLHPTSFEVAPNAVDFHPLLLRSGVWIFRADGCLDLHDLETGIWQRSLPFADVAHETKFNLNGDRVFRLFDDRVEVFETVNGEKMAVLPSKRPFSHALWLSEGRYIAVAENATLERSDGEIQIWDTENARLRNAFRAHVHYINALAEVPGHLLVSTGWDRRTYFWNWQSGEELAEFGLNGTSLQLSHSGDRLAIADEVTRHRHVWMTDAAWEVAHFRADPSLGHLSFSPIGLLTYHNPPRARAAYWPSVAGGVPTRFPPELGLTRFAPDWSHAWSIGIGATGDGLLTRFPLRVERDSGVIDAGPPDLLPLKGRGFDWLWISDDAKHIGVRHQDGFQIVHWGEPPRVITFDGCPGIQLALSPRGDWVVVWQRIRDRRKDQRYPLRVCDGNSGQLIHEIPGSELDIEPIFSPDGRWLRTVQIKDPHYRLYRTKDWSLFKRVERASSVFLEAGGSLSRDGRMAAFITEDRKVSLRETDHWTELGSFPVRTTVCQVVFSTDDSRLAIGSEVGLIDIWDLRLIRKNLAAMGLDFPLPSFPPATNAPFEKPLRWVFVTNPPPRMVSSTNITLSLGTPIR